MQQEPVPPELRMRHAPSGNLETARVSDYFGSCGWALSFASTTRSRCRSRSVAVNGSARGIAGILNDAGNVLGMMPHPERVIEAAHGNSDGRRLFEGLLETVA